MVCPADPAADAVRDHLLKFLTTNLLAVFTGCSEAGSLSHDHSLVADLPQLPKLVPALELLFKDPEEGDAQEPLPEMLS